MSETLTQSITSAIGSMSLTGRREVTCLVDYKDQYVQPLVEAAFRERMPAASFKIITSLAQYTGGPLLQVAGNHDALDLDTAFHQPHMLINSYVVRRALTEKQHLGETCATWAAAHPESVLSSHVKPVQDFEVQRNDMGSMWDALDDTKLCASLQANEDKERAQREWWILKSTVSNHWSGSRLFSTAEELQSIVEAYMETEDGEEHADASQHHHDKRDDSPQNTHEDTSKDDDEEAAEAKPFSWSDIQVTVEEAHHTVAPQHLAQHHFVAQQFVHPPAMVNDRKLHVRAYVVAVGSLNVYVYRPMLAVIDGAEYAAPWESQQPASQNSETAPFWGLSDASTTDAWKSRVFDDVCAVTGEVFKAAKSSRGFQPLQQSFAVFGVDFMVDEQGSAWLLDINEYPDFAAAGSDQQPLVQGLFEEIVDVAVKPFYGFSDAGDSSVEGTEMMVKVA